jgi:hypothetical protein
MKLAHNYTILIYNLRIVIWLVHKAKIKLPKARKLINL